MRAGLGAATGPFGGAWGDVRERSYQGPADLETILCPTCHLLDTCGRSALQTCGPHLLQGRTKWDGEHLSHPGLLRTAALQGDF